MATTGQHSLDSVDKRSVESKARVENIEFQEPSVAYRLYRWRFVGLIAMMSLNIAGGINGAWFGPIANSTASDYGISPDQVNWLGNTVQIIFVPISFLTPPLNKKFGLKTAFLIGSAFLLAGSWIRYASTPRSLSSAGAYTILVISQLFVGIAQPIFLTLGPRYSEVWFDLRGRTTATMVISVCNPVGTAIAQILSPAFDSTRVGILVLAITSSVLILPAFLVRSRPPTPPTFSGGQPDLGLMVTLRAMLFRERPGENTMTKRGKLDFAILILGFGIYVGAIVVFSTLSNQILAPFGYSDDTAGLMGAALILSGLVAAIVTSPLFDRVLTHHLGLTLRLTTPILGAAWLSLIWAIREHNAGALYALFAIIGIISVTILPVTLELASEVTHNTDTAAAMLWCFGNLFAFIFTLVMNALRAGNDANPPLNYKRSMIFMGIVAFAMGFIAQLLHGHQSRRERDEEMSRRNEQSAA